MSTAPRGFGADRSDGRTPLPGSLHTNRRLAQWLRAAGVTRPASAHSLRHAFAMRVYAKTGDVLIVREALRHRSIASALSYARVDSERLRRVIA